MKKISFKVGKVYFFMKRSNDCGKYLGTEGGMHLFEPIEVEDFVISEDGLVRFFEGGVIETSATEKTE